MARSRVSLIYISVLLNLVKSTGLASLVNEPNLLTAYAMPVCLCLLANCNIQTILGMLSYRFLRASVLLDFYHCHQLVPSAYPLSCAVHGVAMSR